MHTPENCDWIAPNETLCASEHKPGTVLATTENRVRVIACRGFMSGTRVKDGRREFKSISDAPGFRVVSDTGHSGPCHVYPPDKTWTRYDEKKRSARANADKEAQTISAADKIMGRTRRQVIVPN